jgi:hypothetical protein
MVSRIYLAPLSSNDDSDAESSDVEMELVSHELPFSVSNENDVGFFKCQYIMLAVKVSIIFWFTSRISSGSKKMEQPSFLATEMMYEAFICFSSSVQKV